MRQDKNFLEDTNTANMVGSLDRNAKPTRMQQLEIDEKPFT